MPELPDITAYVEAINRLLVGQTLKAIRIGSPFLVRSVDPPLSVVVGSTLGGAERSGKRIVLEFAGEVFLVLHLMIAGRFRWRHVDDGGRIPSRSPLAIFEFSNGKLYLTEAGTKRRASLHVVKGREALQSFDRGGLEVMRATRAEFAERLRAENHTLKRSLTDPRLFSGIGNAYSDEILHGARLSPLLTTARMSESQIDVLYEATRRILQDWSERLLAETAGGFPETVTAFREGMAVHGRYGKPCPVCGSTVQRIRYADNETNYCARCQTDGRLLADRSLSRLLRQDWPRSIDELE
ncbi:MAG: Fpg/Nei family DNA glycosylase [Gemmatimonadota bacterium]